VMQKSLAEEANEARRARNFDTREQLLAEMELVTLLRSVLNYVSYNAHGALMLADARDFMRDPQDLWAVMELLSEVSSQTLIAISDAQRHTPEVSAGTKRPGIATEASKFQDFLTEVTPIFKACTEPDTGHH